MFTTEYSGKKYEFFDDRLTVDGVPVPYSEMSDIVHRSGDNPAFVFLYKGRQYALPYDPAEMEQIHPYFMKAKQTSAPVPPSQDTDPSTSTAPEPAVEQNVAPDLEIPKKRFGSAGKLIIALLVLAVAVVVALFACNHKDNDSTTQEPAAVTEETDEHGHPVAGSDAENNSDQEGADEQGDSSDKPEKVTEIKPKGTVEATDGFTVTDADGTISAVLKKVYVGDEALSKLAEMGEDTEEFTENDASYTTVMYEYSIEVKKGRLIGDPLSGEAFLSDKKTELEDYWSYSLDVNADKDMSSGDLELDAGAKATGYYVYGMPSDISDYYERIYTDMQGNSIWVHHDLK